MSWLTTKQGPLLPVVSPYLQNGLFERSRGQCVKDGVKSAIDGENKYDHPGANGACRWKEKRQKEKEIKQQSFVLGVFYK